MGGSKPRLTVDLDMTIADSYTNAMKIVRRRGETPIELKDFTVYDLSKFLRKRSGIFYTKEEVHQLFREAWANPRDIKLVDDRIPGILRCIDDWNIELLTATPADIRQIREFIGFYSIPITQIRLVKNDFSKNVHTGYYHIDDSPDAANAVFAAGRWTILLDMPYNKSSIANRITRVPNWGDVRKSLPEQYQLVT